MNVDNWLQRNEVASMIGSLKFVYRGLKIQQQKDLNMIKEQTKEAHSAEGGRDFGTFLSV